MIFQHTLNKVLSGEKWQTRRIIQCRIVRDDFTGHIIAIKRNGRTLYTVGKTYAVQPARGKPAVARIRITGMRLEPVTSITIEDAIAEGFESCEEFLNAWVEIHGKSGLNKMVWVLEFELVLEIIE